MLRKKWKSRHDIHFNVILRELPSHRIQMKEKIIEVLFTQAREMGEESGQKELLNPTLETKLYHSNGTLDSLGLVRFITGSEEKISDTFGIDIVLADEKAMSQVSSPFVSIGSLADYIEKSLANEGAG